MKCPYCDKEMEHGYIKSSQRIHWGKEKSLGFLPEDLKLTKNFWNGFWNGFFVDAYYCNQCKTITIPLK